MLAWRITKYNPENRNEMGHYLIDEWTAYSDIGKNINGKRLTYAEYLTVENAYINAISLFMDCNNVTELSVFREELWCLLRSANTMTVRFGFDYYMYIGSVKQCDTAIQKIQHSGLFVESCDPEYLK